MKKETNQETMTGTCDHDLNYKHKREPKRHIRKFLKSIVMRLFYRRFMILAHKYNWCYMQPNIWVERGYIHYWCQWCGTRDRKSIMHGKEGHICTEDKCLYARTK